MTNTDHDTSTPQPMPSFLPQKDDDPGVRALKILVLSLGALLILGFLALIGRVAFLIAQPGEREPKPPAIVEQTNKATVPGVLNLPKGATVTTMALSQGQLAVHLNAPEGAMILIIDTATGKEIQRLKIKTQP